MDYKDSFGTKISEIHAVLKIIQNLKKKIQFSLYNLIYFYGVDLLHIPQIRNASTESWKFKKRELRNASTENWKFKKREYWNSLC